MAGSGRRKSAVTLPIASFDKFPPGIEHFKLLAYGRSSMQRRPATFCLLLFSSSPKDNLDQTNSVDAMNAMQEFLNRFPNSKFRDQAIEVITSTQKKLERKGFDNAYQYYKMRSYKAAIVALNNFKNNFPDSEFLEEAYYLVIGFLNIS